MDEMQRLSNLAEASLMARKLDDAIQYFTRAIDLNSANAQLRSRRAYVYFLKDLHEAAEDDVLKAIRLSTSDRERADYYYNLACILHDKGDTDSASPMWQKAIDLDPSRYSMQRILRDNRLPPGSFGAH